MVSRLAPWPRQPAQTPSWAVIRVVLRSLNSARQLHGLQVLRLRGSTRREPEMADATGQALHRVWTASIVRASQTRGSAP